MDTVKEGEYTIGDERITAVARTNEWYVNDGRRFYQENLTADIVSVTGINQSGWYVKQNSYTEFWPVKSLDNMVEKLLHAEPDVPVLCSHVICTNQRLVCAE